MSSTYEATPSTQSLEFPQPTPMIPTLTTDQFAEAIGNLYALWTLDGLVELGVAVASDFFARPQLYLSDEIPTSIAELHASYGTNVRLPDTAQRQAMMLPVFGRSDGLKPDATNASSPFQLARKKLVDACIAFSERAVDTGVPMLEDRVRSALVPLRSHFEGLQGISVAVSNFEVTAIFHVVVRILRSRGIAQIFGVPAPTGGWPVGSNDPNGAKLVEAIGSVLAVAPDYKLSYTKFILLQRVAQEGRRALPLVFSDPQTEPELETLISQVYTWGTSLRDFLQVP